MVKALPESTRAHLEATFEIVLNLAKKVAPEIDANGDSGSFFAKVLDAVAFFYAYTPPNKKEDVSKPVVLYGTAGLRRAFNDMEVTMNDDEKKKLVKLTDLDDFMVFKWLLKESERKVLSSWVKGVFAGGAAQAPASVSKSRATAASDKKPKKAQQTTAADLMSYFA